MGIRPLSKDQFGKVRRMKDRREQRTSVGVGRETPEGVLLRHDWGARSERDAFGCHAGFTGRSDRI
jgi:hypothetical protein